MKDLRRASQPHPGHRSAGVARIGLGAVLAAAMLLPAAANAAQPDPISPAALRQIGALLAEKASRTPAQQKLSTRLLFEIRRQRNDPILVGLPELSSRLEIDEEGRVLVDIKTEVSDELLAWIARQGGRVVNHHPRFDAVRAEVPWSRIEALAEWPELRFIRPAEAFMTRTTVVTEGDVAHKADIARAATGADGTGVKVGAMSDSVDELAAIQAAGELPAVTVLPGQDGGMLSSEGTALLEIIHDMAPEAELFFATGATGSAQFAQNILDLEAAGCDVIVDDIGYFAEGVFQDGDIAQAVDEVAAKGVIFVSAAGNAGNENDGTSGVYEGDYSGTALPAAVVGLGVSAHDFTGSGDNDNRVSEQALNPAPFFTLQWADPLGGSANDYDLFLLNPQGALIEFSADTQNGDDDPYEEIDSRVDDHTASSLVVVKQAGSADKFIHLNTHLGRLEHSTNGQIFGHPAAAGALAVAAVKVDDAGGPGGVFDGSESVETFSSDGPRRIYFEADGSPVAPGAAAGGPGGPSGVPSDPFIIRHKPDVAAADGVSTTSSNFTTFFGTSAAAPHAAAIAALMIDELEALMSDLLADAGLPLIHSVAQARGLFDSTSLDIEAAGFDRDSGAGILDSDAMMDSQSIFADGFESGDTSAWTSE